MAGRRTLGLSLAVGGCKFSALAMLSMSHAGTNNILNSIASPVAGGDEIHSKASKPTRLALMQTASNVACTLSHLIVFAHVADFATHCSV